MDCQVSAGQIKCFLNESVCNPRRLRLGNQQGHYPQSDRLMDDLVKNNGIVDHRIPILRNHMTPRPTTARVATAETAKAASPAR